MELAQLDSERRQVLQALLELGRQAHLQPQQGPRRWMEMLVYITRRQQNIRSRRQLRRAKYSAKSFSFLPWRFSLIQTNHRTQQAPCRYKTAAHVPPQTLVQTVPFSPITVWVSLLREHPVCSYNFLGSLWSLSVRARSDRSPGPTWSQASSHISVVEERLVVGELESILDHALALWKPDDSSELWSAEARDRRGVGAARTQCRKGTRPAARTPWRSPRPWRPPRSARARRP